MKPTIVIASSNAHKVKELEQMLADAALGVELCSMQAFGRPPEIAETALGFAGNAALKSEGIAAWLAGQPACPKGPCWVLADDSGLSVDALDGAPGVLSARFSGQDATDEKNNAKLVKELEALGLASSPAHFCCVLALTRVGSQGPKTHFFEGKAVGEARVLPAGEGGFGYDPHVWIEGQSGSFAQMTGEQKAQVSHRGVALKALLHALPEILQS